MRESRESLSDGDFVSDPTLALAGRISSSSDVPAFCAGELEGITLQVREQTYSSAPHR